jgi:hypothetical protein
VAIHRHPEAVAEHSRHRFLPGRNRRLIESFRRFKSVDTVVDMDRKGV